MMGAGRRQKGLQTLAWPPAPPCRLSAYTACGHCDISRATAPSAPWTSHQETSLTSRVRAGSPPGAEQGSSGGTAGAHGTMVCARLCTRLCTRVSRSCSMSTWGCLMQIAPGASLGPCCGWPLGCAPALGAWVISPFPGPTGCLPGPPLPGTSAPS